MDGITLMAMISIMAFCIMLGMAMKPQEATSIGKRLESLQKEKANARKSLRDEEEMNKSFIVRIVLPFADKMSKHLSGFMPTGMIEAINVDIARAGMVGKVSASQIMTISYFLMAGLPGLFLLILAAKSPWTWMDYSIILIAFVMGWRLPRGVIQGKAKRRMHEIQLALPFTLDLISISVEAGMAFDGAMGMVCEKTRGPLTDELNQSLREIRLGKSRNQALNDLGERVGVDDLKTFLTAVTYISKLGGSLVDVIKIQAQALRIKRRQRAEEKAMKTPVKIMIPLVLFIFPSMFIVILGPAGITLVGEMSSVPGQ